MGLSATLSNALAGMDLSQRGLTIVSRNVANSGTPGYHRQSLRPTESLGANSVGVRAATVQRAYDLSLERQFQKEASQMGALSVRAGFLNQVDQLLGKPGSVNSLDTQLANFKGSLQSLSTSPDDFVARAQVVDRAQSLTETLNFLSKSTQAMRVETESQITAHVAELNQSLQSLAEINHDLRDTTRDDETRISVLDERDRLISSVSELIDVRADYRPDGSVALHTRSGVGLLDLKASQFEFDNAGNLSANSLYNRDDAQSGVGELSIVTASGLKMDVVEFGILHSGKIQSLLEMRDETLVTLQDHLDEIAGSMAQAMNSVESAGAAVTAGAANGFEVDIASMQPGNHFALNYSEAGVSKTVRVVRVDDATQLPMDETGADGIRTIGLDFSGGAAAVAGALDTALGAGVTVSNPSGDVIRVLDDGAGGATDIKSLSVYHTVTADQGAGTALSLFVDAGGQAFTNSLDGGAPQKRGFAERISVNANVIADNSLLVKHEATTAAGDETRPNALIDRLENMQFVSETRSDLHTGKFRVSGNVDSVLRQVLNYHGNVVATANQARDSQAVVMDTIEQRAEEAYGVDIDEEMAMLLELQNAYAANARVVTITKELIDTLMQI